MGDEVQAIKAGLLEVADIVVVNKGDRPGAQRTASQLRAMLVAVGRAGGGGAGRRERAAPAPRPRPKEPEVLAHDRHDRRRDPGAARRRWIGIARAVAKRATRRPGSRARRRRSGRSSPTGCAADLHEAGAPRRTDGDRCAQVAAHELDPFAAADRLLAEPSGDRRLDRRRASARRGSSPGSLRQPVARGPRVLRRRRDPAAGHAAVHAGRSCSATGFAVGIVSGAFAVASLLMRPVLRPPHAIGEAGGSRCSSARAISVVAAIGHLAAEQRSQLLIVDARRCSASARRCSSSPASRRRPTWRRTTAAARRSASSRCRSTSGSRSGRCIGEVIQSSNRATRPSGSRPPCSYAASVGLSWMVAGDVAAAAARRRAAEQAPADPPARRRARPARAVRRVGHGPFFAFIPLHASSDLGIGTAAPYLGVFAIVVVILRLVGARLPDQLGASRLTGTALVAAAIGLLISGLAVGEGHSGRRGAPGRHDRVRGRRRVHDARDHGDGRRRGAHRTSGARGRDGGPVRRRRVRAVAGGARARRHGRRLPGDLPRLRGDRRHRRRVPAGAATRPGAAAPCPGGVDLTPG